MLANRPPFTPVRCRFCDTEIADKALICFRCGRATSDRRVEPPPPARRVSGAAVAGVAAAGAGLAAALPVYLDDAVLWSGWAGIAAIVGLAVGWWRRSRARAR
jgi:hypothetical protein